MSYHTEEELEKVRTWEGDPHGLMAYVRGLWCWPSYFRVGYKQVEGKWKRDKVYRLSTCGLVR